MVIGVNPPCGFATNQTVWTRCGGLIVSSQKSQEDEERTIIVKSKTRVSPMSCWVLKRAELEHKHVLRCLKISLHVDHPREQPWLKKVRNDHGTMFLVKIMGKTSIKGIIIFFQNSLRSENQNLRIMTQSRAGGFYSQFQNFFIFILSISNH